MTHIERYFLLALITFLAASAAFLYGRSEESLCLQQTGPDVLVAHACTGVR